MISQELAEKLKDAGFPNYDRIYNRVAYPADVYIPTLSELIQACGNEFWSLVKDETLEGVWYARSHPHHIDPMGTPMKKCILIRSVNSPEDAVANLFIKIGKIK